MADFQPRNPERRSPFRATRLWNQLLCSFREGMQLKRKRWRLKSYDNCFSGSEALEWLHNYLQNHPAFSGPISRDQAFQLLQKFLERRVFVSATGKDGERFQDGNFLYTFSDMQEADSVPTEATKSTQEKNPSPILQASTKSTTDKENFPHQRSLTNLLKSLSSRKTSSSELQTPLGKPTAAPLPHLVRGEPKWSRIFGNPMTPLALDLNNISVSSRQDNVFVDCADISACLLDGGEEDHAELWDTLNVSAISRFSRSSSLRLHKARDSLRGNKPRLDTFWESKDREPAPKATGQCIGLTVGTDESLIRLQKSASTSALPPTKVVSVPVDRSDSSARGSSSSDGLPDVPQNERTPRKRTSGSTVDVAMTSAAKKSKFHEANGSITKSTFASRKKARSNLRANSEISIETESRTASVSLFSKKASPKIAATEALDTGNLSRKVAAQGSVTGNLLLKTSTNTAAIKGRGTGNLLKKAGTEVSSSGNHSKLGAIEEPEAGNIVCRTATEGSSTGNLPRKALSVLGEPVDLIASAHKNRFTYDNLEDKFPGYRGAAAKGSKNYSQGCTAKGDEVVWKPLNDLYQCKSYDNPITVEEECQAPVLDAPIPRKLTRRELYHTHEPGASHAQEPGRETADQGQYRPAENVVRVPQSGNNAATSKENGLCRRPKNELRTKTPERHESSVPCSTLGCTPFRRHSARTVKPAADTSQYAESKCCSGAVMPGPEKALRENVAAAELVSCGSEKSVEQNGGCPKIGVDAGVVNASYKLTAEDIEETWLSVVLLCVKKIVGLDYASAVLDISKFKGGDVMKNVNWKCEELTQDAPDWLISAMNCLMAWPVRPYSDPLFRELPNYPGFERDIYRAIKEHYVATLTEPLMTFHVYPLLKECAELLFDSSESALRLLQLCILLLPCWNRRQLQLLVIFMAAVATNESLELSRDLPNRDLLIHSFFHMIMRREQRVKLASYDDAASIRITSFLMDHHEEVFQAPSGLRFQVDHKLAVTLGQSDPAGRSAAVATQQTHQSQPPAYKNGMVRQRSYCQQITVEEFNEQAKCASVQAVHDLLENLVTDQSLPEKERKKRLKQFQKAYPDIYAERFGNESVSTLNSTLTSRAGFFKHALKPSFLIEKLI